MITKISNYTINNKCDKNQACFSYIDMVEVTSEDVKLESIRNNRSISVDVLLDERPSEDLDQRYPIEGIYSTMDTITPKIFSFNMTASIYKNPVDIENATFNLLNRLTSSSTNKDITIIGKSPSEIEKRILLMMQMCSENIIQESRMGRATTIILGKNVLSYLSDIDMITKIHFDPINFNILVSEKIDPNKIIVMRVDNKCGMGINLVNNPDKSIFYLKETLDYHKVIKWFTVQ